MSSLRSAPDREEDQRLYIQYDCIRRYVFDVGIVQRNSTRTRYESPPLLALARVFAQPAEDFVVPLQAVLVVQHPVVFVREDYEAARDAESGGRSG